MLRKEQSRANEKQEEEMGLTRKFFNLLTGFLDFYKIRIHAKIMKPYQLSMGHSICFSSFDFLSLEK